ncbi:hypothetical protein BGZ76_011147 [Entomortierella beljakovae]|nr:hypothetical protein BGZ76_011147 [Entomortierella beljakovae]
MSTDTEKYLEQTSLPFTSAELGSFHRFHGHKWDEDDQFQAGLQTITQAQAAQPSNSELLKMKQYYFSTRIGVQINLDDYLTWRKHLETPSDDPNVPIFKRFDDYNFDNDTKFQKGLPMIIGQLVKDGKSTLDKAALQKEMTKAKAFYYARFIELFDFPAYLEWKELEKSQTGPACPFAHLWQNKGKGPANELAEDAKKFLTVTPPVSTGALKLHVHSPATKNVWTSHRLAKLSQAISPMLDQDNITSAFLTANSGSSSLDQRDPESMIVSKDEKWFTGGLVASQSTDSQDPSKTKELLRQYYSVVNQMSEVSSKSDKPFVVIVDGMVSLSASYLIFGSGSQVAITENATLSFTPLEPTDITPNEVSTPFSGLYLLSLIQANAKNDTSARPLPKGIGHYLAFCPDYILRGPDLRKLGLADFFISSSKKKDIEEAIVSVAGCPPPHTTSAIRMALNTEVVYPGPAKIDVWRSEIQECFGDAKSVGDIVTNLEKYDNNWSKSIRAYISSLGSTLANLLFEAIKRSTELTSFQECARLEYRLTQRYKEYTSSHKEGADDEDLDSFFEPIEGEETDLFSFPFSEWTQEHEHEEEFGSVSAVAVSDEQDPSKACPYLASKTNANVVPSDHPGIAGVDMSDPDAVKSCPFLSAKNPQDTSVPSDHPKIPGVDLTDPEASKACPFLSSKNSQSSTESQTEPVPSDHPNIAGLNLSNPESVKACPFLSAKNGHKEVTTTKESTVPSDHPKIPGVDFSDPDAVKKCPYLATNNSTEATI